MYMMTAPNDKLSNLSKNDKLSKSKLFVLSINYLRYNGLLLPLFFVLHPVVFFFENLYKLLQGNTMCDRVTMSKIVMIHLYIPF